ncbi:MAG: heme o synthase [Pyrinomonadaceae bacterium]
MHRMERTASRLPLSGIVTPTQAFALGLGLTLFAEAYLALFVNPLTALLGVAVVVGYVLIYTPLKTRTSLSTVLGAFPGAMPPLMGFTAASNTLGAEGLALFAILFVWQFPHFLAIATMYREDYGRAGILMLPVVEQDGRITAQQIVIYSLLLLPVSLLPTMLGMAGQVYFFGALILGGIFLYVSITTALTRSRQHSRRLLLTSVLYLPLLFLLMVLNH